jgi:hypothetical protein
MGEGDKMFKGSRVQGFKGSKAGGLRFGTRVMEEATLARLMQETLYEALPDRKRCVICERPLIKNIHYPCCTKECRRKYKEWLNSS